MIFYDLRYAVLATTLCLALFALFQAIVLSVFFYSLQMLHRHFQLHGSDHQYYEYLPFAHHL